jgi:hypothetical protein
MKNYKVNINRKPLTDEELASSGDFGKLLNTYKAMKPPLYKTVKFWAGSGAIAAVLTTAIVLLTFNKHDVMDANATPPFINPPVAEANIPTDKFIINTASDTVVNYKTGSKLYVPANAFLDENNNPIQGEVELNYREFHDVADVFIAGIPMNYDSAGETFHFETAGMMDIGAVKDGKNLKVNPSAQIKVDMVSGNTDDRFNTYYLDTANKRWVYQTQSNYMAALTAPSVPAKAETASETATEPQSATTKELAEVKKQLQEVVIKQDAPAVKPVEPVKIDKAKPRFSIKVDEKEFPELASYNGVKFQVVNEKEYLPEKANTEWEEVDLKKIEGTPNYKITFSNSKEKFTVTATPAFAEKDYAEAKKVYDEKYKQYQAGLTNRKAEEERKRVELEARAKDLEEQMRREIAEQKKRIQEYEKNMAQTQLFYRTFTVAKFGTWNCDHPQAYPQGAVIAANFTDENGKKLNLSAIYLIEKGRNAMFSYRQGQVTRLSFNPSKENFIWAITNEKKMCVISADRFKEAAKSSGTVDFKLEVIDRQFSSSDEVKQYLKI